MICVFHYTSFTYKKTVFEQQAENIYTHKQYIFIHTSNINIYLCMKNLNIYTQLKYSILNTILFVQNYNLFKIRFPNIFSLLLVSSTIYLLTNSVRNFITTPLIRIISL